MCQSAVVPEYQSVAVVVMACKLAVEACQVVLVSVLVYQSVVV